MVKHVALLGLMAAASIAPAQLVSTVWAKTDRFGGATIPGATAALTNGNFVVLSTVTRSGRTDGVLSCYSPTGSTVWVKTIWASNVFRPTALVPTTAGDVYVVGSTGLSGSIDTYIARVSPAGATIWAQRFENSLGSADDMPFAASRDGSNNLYVTGECRRTVGNATKSAYVLKISTGGNRAYQAIQSIALGQSAQGTSLSVGSTGEAAVGVTAPTSRVWKLNANGQTTVWKPLIILSDVTSVLLDPTGNIFLGGRYKNSSSDSAPAVQKLSSTGALQWTRWMNFDYAGNSLDSVTALRRDTSGNIWAGGYAAYNDLDFMLMKLNTSGTIVAARLNNSGTATSVDMGSYLELGPSQEPYMAGGMTTATGAGFMAFRANSDGSYRWERWVPGAGGVDYEYKSAVLNQKTGQMLLAHRDAATGNAVFYCLTQPATAVADTYSIPRNTTLNGQSVLRNDTFAADGDAVLVNDASHGTLTLNADGTFLYRGDTGYNGIDTFSYRITKPGVAASNTVTVVITVT